MTNQNDQSGFLGEAGTAGKLALEGMFHLDGQYDPFSARNLGVVGTVVEGAGAVAEKVSDCNPSRPLRQTALFC